MREITLLEPFNHLLVVDVIDHKTHRTTLACGDFKSANDLGLQAEANEAWTEELIQQFEESQQQQNPAPPGLDELKAFAVLQIRHFATEFRAKFAEDADQYKLAGWNDKAQRALRVTANTASDADIAILQTECAKRGNDETPQALAQKQAAKAQAFANAVAIIDGMEAAALATIESQSNENALSAVRNQLQTEATAELNSLLGE